MNEGVSQVFRAACGASLTLVMQFAVFGQSARQALPDSVFRADSSLALVRFQVIGKNGYLPDLAANEIELREDGVPQKIALFEGGTIERSTITEVHLLFDCSNSVQRAGKFDPHVFDANILRRFPNARIAIWGFSGQKLVDFTGPTRSSDSLNGAMERVRRMKSGDSPIYHSISRVADRLSGKKGQAVRLIVTISDGLPFADDHRPQDAVYRAKRAGIALYPALIYSIRLSAGDSPLSPRQRKSDWARQSEFLGIANSTGGQAFEFGGSGKEDLLDRILQGIATEIHSEYVVGYYPVPGGKPRVHKAQVLLKDAARGRILGGARDIEH